jgi:hypothetical protein
MDTRDAPVIPRVTSSARRWHTHRMNASTRAAWIVGSMALVALVGNVTEITMAGASGVSGRTATHEYSLPSDGWTTNRVTSTSLFGGTFHAGLTKSGAGAWIGPNAMLWPAGYHVRFNPTQLIDSRGRIVAKQGQRVSAGGELVGTASWPNASHCYAGGNLVAVTGSVFSGKRAGFPF